MKCIPNKRQSAWLQTGRVRATAACTSKHSQKIFMLQSAMEYLMTYGWAILILTVVIGALYSMGIFGSTTSAPRAQPGSCRVFRPNGPGTTAYINLEGVCTGQLPQFVATFSGSNKKVTVPANPNWNANSLTVSVWFYATSQAVGVVGTYNQGTNWGIWVSNPPSRFEVMDGPSNWQSPQIQLNTWYDAAIPDKVFIEPAKKRWIQKQPPQRGQSHSHHIRKQRNRNKQETIKGVPGCHGVPATDEIWRLRLCRGCETIFVRVHPFDVMPGLVAVKRRIRRELGTARPIHERVRKLGWRALRQRMA